MSPLKRVLSWAMKSGLGGLTGGATVYGFADAFKAERAPSQIDLVNSYKNIAYTCAMINAAAVASTPLRLFVQTSGSQRQAKCPTRPVGRSTERRLRSRSGLDGRLAKAVRIEEVTRHPLLDLLHRANPHHTRYDLLELTVLSQEITGNAYWRLKDDALGVPAQIWPLHAHMMTPVPDYATEQVVLEYVFSSGVGQQVFRPDEIAHFKYPSLADPYISGWSPLRAAYEHAVVTDKMLAYEEALLDNRARPDMLISPREPIGQQEATRLERKIQNKFRWGGSGGVLVGESGLDYKPLVFPPSDLAALQVRQVSAESLANAFGIPLSLLKTEDVNRANAEAGHYQHALLSVRPKCLRLQEKINKDVCPRFDPDGRLFVAFDDPVPANAAEDREDRKLALQTGYKVINEVREEEGLPPVPWGDEPILPITMAALSDREARVKPRPAAPNFGKSAAAGAAEAAEVAGTAGAADDHPAAVRPDGLYAHPGAA
jgi:HK97 family phage portal protein